MRKMQQPLLSNGSNSSPKNSINYQTTSTDVTSIWDRLSTNRFEDIPLDNYKELKTVNGFKSSSDDEGLPIYTPDIYKGSKKGEVARYNKIHQHVTKQYTKLKTFLEGHTEEDYQDLAKRIPFDEYITQMTDFYASQGFYHNNPSAKKSLLKWVIRLGKASQFDEVIFCIFNLQEAVEGLGGAWYLWLIFLIPTLLQIIPNALSIQPEDEAKQIIDPDYTKFKVSLPKNLAHVKFLHHVLNILEENKQTQLSLAKLSKYLLPALSGLVFASTTYLISNRYDIEDQTKYILTASSGLVFPFLTYTGILGTGITYTNTVFTVGTFLITNIWGSAAQGVPVLTALMWLFKLPSNLATIIPTATPIYLFFLGIGFTYYILQAGRDTWDSALTYFSQKNPMVRVFLISFFSGLEIFVQYAINSLRRGFSMSGIVTAMFKSFNKADASYAQKLLEKIAFVAGTDSTAKSRNSGANYFLKPFTFDLFGEKFVLPDNKLLDYDKAKSSVSLTSKEILKMLGYSTTYALSLGAGTGLGVALFTEKLWSIVISALTGTAVAGLSKFYSLRTELINAKARAHIDTLCGNKESDAYEPKVKSLTFFTLLADNGMRVIGIAGMSAAVSLFSDYNQSILYYTFLCGSLLPIISEWDFLKPKASKGNQELVDGAREAVGSHMYLMSELPDDKELAKYKNTFVLIKQAEHKDIVTITAPQIYFINDEAKQELLTPAKVKQKNTVKYAVDRITDTDELKPIYDRSGNSPKQVKELYQVLNKIKSSPQDLESKRAESESEEEENEDERPQGKCSRACDCVSFAMARLTVSLFGSVKPQAAEEEEEEESSSPCCVIS